MSARRGGALAALARPALLAACGSAPEPARPATAAPAQRIVTLAPDLTELVYAAGAGPRLVGAIEHSDYPDAARSLPRIGDAFGLDYERLRALEPDLILAWDGGTPQRWIERLRALGLRVVPLGVHRLEDVASELEEIGRLAGSLGPARAAASAYLEGLAALRARNAGMAPVTVFFQISAQPLYTVGGAHAISAMIELCGGRNVFGDLGTLAADVSQEAVLGRDPEVILAGDDAGPGALDGWRRWPALAAVARGNLYLVPSDLVSRSSTRLLSGMEEICAALARARSARARRGVPRGRPCAGPRCAARRRRTGCVDGRATPALASLRFRRTKGVTPCTEPSSARRRPPSRSPLHRPAPWTSTNSSSPPPALPRSRTAR